MPKRESRAERTVQQKSTKRVRNFRKLNKRRSRVDILLTEAEISRIRHAAKEWRCSQQSVLRLALTALEPVFTRNLALDQAVDLFSRTRDRILQPLLPQAPLPDLCPVRTTGRSAAEAQALLRAGGKCDLCGRHAPFRSRDGHPYLELHSIRSQKVHRPRPDDPRGIAALCPNCHKQVHFGQNGIALNGQLSLKFQSE